MASDSQLKQAEKKLPSDFLWGFATGMFDVLGTYTVY